MRKFCVFLIGFLIVPYLLIAQAQLTDAAAIGVHESNYNDPFIHRAGAGLSIGISEISSGSLAFMFSSFYQYRFNSLFAVEVSASVLHAGGKSEYFNYRPEYTSATQVRLIPEHIASGGVSHSLAGNITAVFVPFAEKRLQLGLGASVRWAGILGSFITTRLDSLSQTFRVIDTQQFALGANAHCEYIFPLAGNVDLGVRLHSQFFLPPFAVVGQREPIGYITRQRTSATTTISFPPAFYGLNGGLGAFLRIGF